MDVVMRPDIDIEEDIREFIRTYDPLKQARGHFDYTVQDGHVTVTGHVRSVQARRVLLDNVPDIGGVVSMDDSQFFDDETIRLHVGKALPRGTFVRVNYGSVVITGMIPDGTDAATIIEKVKEIEGVRPDRIATDFLNA